MIEKTITTVVFLFVILIAVCNAVITCREIMEDVYEADDAQKEEKKKGLH